MRTILGFIALAFSTAALAQEPPAAESPAPIPEPLEQEKPEPIAPAPVEPAPPPDGKPAPPPAPEKAVEQETACLPIGIGSTLAGGITGAIGGMTLCVGGTLANFSASSGSDDCVTACINALFEAFVITIGIVIAAGGLLVLGPAAAIAATIAASAAAAGAGRQTWPAILGGSIGIVTGVLGVGLMLSGAFDASPYPFIANEPLDVSRPSHIAVVSGLGLVITAGLVSIVGAIALDATVGGPDETKAPQPSPGPPPGSTTVMFIPRALPQAY